MPKPITLTKKIKQEAIKDFSSMLDNVKMSTGKLTYTKDFSYKTGNITVWLTLDAYTKIVTLLKEFTDEVGWHGVVTRLSEYEFKIEDILVYPQEVTGATVVTDQEEYSKWLYELDDSVFNLIRMQGHSHVNMGVSPSNVDEHHRQKILDQLEADMFYIFMIWNKSLSINTVVYDMKRNVLYENEEVQIKLIGEENLEGFITNAKENVKKVSFTNKNKKYKKQSAAISEREFNRYDFDSHYAHWQSFDFHQ